MLLPTTNPVVLLPIESAPLPHHFRFKVLIPTGITKQKVVIVPGATTHPCWPLIDQETLEPCGFSKLTRQLFQYVEQQNLWGQVMQVRANYHQPNNVILQSTQSAPQLLQLPANPVLINSPNKVDGIASKGYGILQPPQGLRLFWTQLPNCPGHNAWFVNADNRLSQSPNLPGLDCFSFWISALALPIKSSAATHSGDAFAQLIKATRLPPGFASSQATVAQIAAAAGANAWAFDSCIFWNASRLLFYTPNSGMPGVREFSSGGLQFSTMQQFAASQSPGAVWKLGRYPKTYPAAGLASVI